MLVLRVQSTPRTTTAGTQKSGLGVEISDQRVRNHILESYGWSNKIDARGNRASILSVEIF